MPTVKTEQKLIIIFTRNVSSKPFKQQCLDAIPDSKYSLCKTQRFLIGKGFGTAYVVQAVEFPVKYFKIKVSKGQVEKKPL